LYEDETAEFCHWHIPEAHFLETWSDIRCFDGTVTIQQPLIAPLYQGKSCHEVLATLLGEPDRPALEIVREYWKKQHLPGEFEEGGRDSSRDGLIAQPSFKPKPVTPTPRAVSVLSPAGERQSDSGDLELVFRPDPTIWDGRYANNAWLQELPKPLTR